jgi:hypothetical protein
VQPAIESAGTAEGLTLNKIMKNIKIEVIPHKKQAYETIGNYTFDADGDILIEVSDMGDWRYNMLVAFHELAEVLQVKFKGIRDEDIVAFDKNFELNRQPGNDEEPGDQPNALYHKEHVFAECLERLLARELGVNWKEYTEKVMAL